MLSTLLQSVQNSVPLIQEQEPVKGKRSAAASSRRQYAKRKAAGLCTYFGCSAKPLPDRQYCGKHLRGMVKRQKKIIDERKNKGLCTYCGSRAQFWGRLCIICRQTKTKNPLPFGARRALKLYRQAESAFELELLQVRVRFEVRKLLASGQITGEYAKALRLYAAVDKNGFETYEQVAKAMRLSRERVRQLLKPSKILLAENLTEVPWKAVRRGKGDAFPRRFYQRKGVPRNSSRFDAQRSPRKQ